MDEKSHTHTHTHTHTLSLSLSLTHARAKFNCIPYKPPPEPSQPLPTSAASHGAGYHENHCPICLSQLTAMVWDTSDHDGQVAVVTRIKSLPEGCPTAGCKSPTALQLTTGCEIPVTLTIPHLQSLQSTRRSPTGCHVRY